MAKTIIIKDADYSANKVDTVSFGNTDPAFVVVGGYNARPGSNGIYNENVFHAETPGKYGIIVANNADTNLKTWDRSGVGEYDGNFRFVPIQIPSGAKRINLKYVGSDSITFKTRFLFCDSTQSPSGYVGVKYVDGKTGSTTWDQDSAVTDYTIAIPELPGLDSFGVCVNVNDYALYWNTDNTGMFEITYLYTAS